MATQWTKPNPEPTIRRMTGLRPNVRRVLARKLPWSRMSEAQRAAALAVLNAGARWPVAQQGCG